MAPFKLWTFSTIGILACTLCLSMASAAAEQGFTKVIVPCVANQTFQCVKDGLCIKKQYLCDGIQHCSDDSDEQGCQTDECDDKQFFTCKLNINILTSVIQDVLYCYHVLLFLFGSQINSTISTKYFFNGIQIRDHLAIGQLPTI